MACSEAEDAGGLAPAKDGNEAARHFIRRTLPILNCVDYIRRVLNDGELDDPECFRRVEAIVNALEANGIHTTRHDF